MNAKISRNDSGDLAEFTEEWAIALRSTYANELLNTYNLTCVLWTGSLLSVVAPSHMCNFNIMQPVPFRTATYETLYATICILNTAVE